MNEPYYKKLPRVLIQLHYGKDLQKPNAYVKITIGSLQSDPFLSPQGKRTLDPEWGDEFLMGIENGPKPFLCVVTAFGAKTMGADSPIGTFQVDLLKDLGMRFSGDKRRFDFPLNTQGTLCITFTAQTDFLFPSMNMNPMDGLPSTICLPFSPNPMVEFTAYQAIHLGEEKRLQSQVLVQLRTFDFNALPGARPEKTKTILKTKPVRGHFPFWGEKCKTPLYTNRDSIKIVFSYTCGKKGAKEEETVKIIELEELAKLATATETRRWIPFENKFKGGYLGLEIRALSNMLAVDGLPEPPGILSVEEWNERQKNGGRHAVPANSLKIETTPAPVPYDILGTKVTKEEPQVEEPHVGTHISDLLTQFNNIPVMSEDDTQDTLYLDAYEGPVRGEMVDMWKDVEGKFREVVNRTELEISRMQLEIERQNQAKEKQALKSQWNQLNDERARFLDGGLGSLAVGGSKFRTNINNLLEDIHSTADAAHGKAVTMDGPDPLDPLPPPPLWGKLPRST